MSAPGFDSGSNVQDVDETSRDICELLRDFPKLLGDPESGGRGDVLSAFGRISGTLRENAQRRRKGLKAAAARLSAAEELLEEAGDQADAAHGLSEALGKAKDALLGGYGAKPIREAGREAGWTYHALCMAYKAARSASEAAASAMEAMASEVRAATRVAPAASMKAALAPAANVDSAAGKAQAAAKEANSHAVRAAAEVLGMLRILRDSKPQGIIEKIKRGINELEAIAAITEAAAEAVGEMVSQMEDKAAGAEEAAMNAVAAAAKADVEAEAAGEEAELAEEAGGTAEAPEGTVEEVAGASSPREKIVQEFLEELDSLVHTSDFLKQSLGGATVQRKLPKETRESLSELDSLQQRRLAEFSRRNRDKSPEELLEGSLKIIRKISQSRKDLVREQILKVSDFQKLDVLNRFLDHEDSERGFLRSDLEHLRGILKKREAAPEKPRKGLSRATPATSAAPGKTSPAMDSLPILNCFFNNKYMRAVVDKSATYNIVSEAWIKEHNMPQDAKRYQTLRSADGSVIENCPCLVGSVMVKVKSGSSRYLKDVEFVMQKGFKRDALLGWPFLKRAQITRSSTGQLLFAKHDEMPGEEGAPIEGTSKAIIESLLDFPKMPPSGSGEGGDLLSAFGDVSETLKQNAKKRREDSKAAEAELAAAEESLDAADGRASEAHEFSKAVGKAKDSVLDTLRKEYEAEPAGEASRAAGFAYYAVCAAHSAAGSASVAAASVMDATVSEVRVATACRVALAAAKKAVEASAADVSTAAGKAKVAAKEAGALAAQAAAGSLGLLKKFRDLAPQEIIEKIETGIKELEAIAAITEAARGVVRETVSQTEGKAADAEKEAKNAARAAEEARRVAEAAEGAVEGAAEARPPMEKIAQEIQEELDSLVHTKAFLKQTLGGIPLEQKLPKETLESLSELESLEKDQMAEFSRQSRDKSPEERLGGELKIMAKIGQARKDLVREQILKLGDFQKLDVLNQFLDSEGSERGALRDDLELRRKNLKKREAVFEKSKKCLFCASPTEILAASGETDSTVDLTLKLNCIFNNRYMRAVIDTGATGNVVSEDWIKKYNLPRESGRTESMLSANGTVTDNCPCLAGPWRFKDKGAPTTEWKDVKFVMLRGHREDALLGMPFLKLTQIIHSSTGQILFAEYEEIPRKEGAPRPIYPSDTTEPN